MLDVLKVRIYPNKKQDIALTKNFGCCRFVWNYYLNKTNNQYEETGKGMTYCQMAKDLTFLKKLSEYEWLTDATAATLQQSLKNLETAFKNFFAKRARFPKFKSKHRKQSIRYPESCSIRNNGLKFPKLGIVKAKLSKDIKGKIKSVTVSKTCTGKYFAAILFETDDLTVNKKAKISGIDLGLSSLVTVFDVEKHDNFDPIKPTRKYAKRLRRRQQKLSRKLKGSNNCCGFKNDVIDLSVRDWICPNCQTHHDTDENAAKNLRAEGLRILLTNTAGQSEFQACGEDIRLVNTCVKKRMRPSRRRTAACTRTKQQSSVNQESPVKLTL